MSSPFKWEMNGTPHWLKLLSEVEGVLLSDGVSWGNGGKKGWGEDGVEERKGKE